MEIQTKIFGLQPKQVALLFTIGSNNTFADAKNRTDQFKADVLKFRLSKVFLPERTESFEMSPVTAQLSV